MLWTGDKDECVKLSCAVTDWWEIGALYSCHVLWQIGERCCCLRCLDLSYCSRLQSGIATRCLLSLPETLRELSLCGILLQDERLFVNAMCRLKMLKEVQFCGVPALNDTTMEEVSTYDVLHCLSSTLHHMHAMSKSNLLLIFYYIFNQFTFNFTSFLCIFYVYFISWVLFKMH